MTNSVYALKPNFSNKEGYIAWHNTWKAVYQHISSDILRRKHEFKDLQREVAKAPTDENKARMSKMQKSLVLQRGDARKLMTLLEEAKLLWQRIVKMQKQLREQNAQFPLTIDARVIDFSFNRIHNEFGFMPRWLVKANGKTFYIEHFISHIGFSTREMTDPKTKGMLRFRNASMTIDQSNTAIITHKAAKVALAI